MTKAPRSDSGAPPAQPGDGTLPEGVDVLVVDDSEIARAALVRTLSGAGFNVHELATPIGLTYALLRQPVRAVLIDLDMPSLRGDKVVLLLRRNPRFAPIKLVLFSGLPTHELEALGAGVGADAVVSKADSAAIVAVLRRLLGEVGTAAG